VRLGISRGIPISLLPLMVFNVFRYDRSRAAGGGVALFVNRSIKATLAYKSAAGSYFEYMFWFLFASMMSLF
jgi:hypothetical protein